MNHRFFKLATLVSLVTLILILVNACSQQNNSRVVIPDIPVGAQPSINVNEKVNALQQELSLIHI